MQILEGNRLLDNITFPVAFRPQIGPGLKGRRKPRQVQAGGRVEHRSQIRFLEGPFATIRIRIGRVDNFGGKIEIRVVPAGENPGGEFPRAGDSDSSGAVPLAQVPIRNDSGGGLLASVEAKHGGRFGSSPARNYRRRFHPCQGVLRPGAFEIEGQGSAASGTNADKGIFRRFQTHFGKRVEPFDFHFTFDRPLRSVLGFEQESSLSLPQRRQGGEAEGEGGGGGERLDFWE
jgi:hypothetical protein